MCIATCLIHFFGDFYFYNLVSPKPVTCSVLLLLAVHVSFTKSCLSSVESERYSIMFNNSAATGLRLASLFWLASSTVADTYAYTHDIVHIIVTNKY